MEKTNQNVFCLLDFQLFRHPIIYFISNRYVMKKISTVSVNFNIFTLNRYFVLAEISIDRYRFLTNPKNFSRVNREFIFMCYHFFMQTLRFFKSVNGQNLIELNRYEMLINIKRASQLLCWFGTAQTAALDFWKCIIMECY